MLYVKRNERDWAGQLISWIKSSIEKKSVIFEDATNDTSVKVESGKTKFPDVLLFSDRTSGVIFNGWELKFPDTPVDDRTMLENALEKAKKIKSESFVTWNGAETIIWKIDTSKYDIDSLKRLKVYPKISTINTRDDLADPSKYAKNEKFLQERLDSLLHDLDQLCRNGELKPALDISGNIVEAIIAASSVIVPQFQLEIVKKKGDDNCFKKEFNKWKIYESATLQILESSSRKLENVVPEEILAKFTFYNLIGKILFYMTLSENMSRELPSIKINTHSDVKHELESCFKRAQAIDYQAIFKPYFTDTLEFSTITEIALYNLLSVLTEFDFKILPTEVIGHILENLVPNTEKQKFGQYFTPSILANLVAYPAVKTKNDVLMDPTCGTGTFLTSFYNILSYLGKQNHSDLLNQIWGNDISHFPAILSVINLYKQNVSQVENFPRVIRDDYFNLTVGSKIIFPDSKDFHKQIDVSIPQFDGIASNFPFIQQEDIPNEDLLLKLNLIFGKTQVAFLKGNNFGINKRSDYFTYCVYNSLRFLKDGGVLSVITSNAWLVKEYGLQFKRFLLDNFHIKYIVKSDAEHWFKDSLVSTIFFVVEKKHSIDPTKFVTIHTKLENYFGQRSLNDQISRIDEFYADIDNCELLYNKKWSRDQSFPDLYKRNDGNVSVCIIPNAVLQTSIEQAENWNTYFLSADIFTSIKHCLTTYYPHIVNVFRGERTGWNKMFVIKNKDVHDSKIANQYLEPYVKSSRELLSMEYSGEYRHYLFSCQENIENLDSGTRSWINKYYNTKNKNGSATIAEVCAGHHPFWYSLKPKKAHIVTSINPYERFFFTYSTRPFTIDQRLIAMSVKKGYDVELIAVLLNSIISYWIIAFKGINRYLGVLDLNANNLKTFCTLNPDLLSDEQKRQIKEAFRPLKNRKIGTISEECKKGDRRNFDKVVMKCFGINVDILPIIYELLCSVVDNRASLSGKRNQS